MTLAKIKRHKPMFNPFFDDFFNRDLQLGRLGHMSEKWPQANVLENEKNWTIELSAPGRLKNEFNLEVKNDALIITYDHHEENTQEKENYMRREFKLNSFSRSFILPETVDKEKIEASYQDGILNIVLPKLETVVSEKIKSIEVR